MPLAGHSKSTSGGGGSEIHGSAPLHLVVVLAFIVIVVIGIVIGFIPG